MEREINDFISYLHNIKKTSNNTELSYKRDLAKLRQYLEEKGINDVKDITEEMLDCVFRRKPICCCNHFKKCCFY